MQPSPMRRHSRRIWPRFAEPSGSCMPSARSAGRRPCWPILSRYTHRVAIANSRLIACGRTGVTFHIPLPRFPPLEVCGRRPRARSPTVTGPASENLHRSGCEQSQRGSPLSAMPYYHVSFDWCSEAIANAVGGECISYVGGNFCLCLLIQASNCCCDRGC